MRRQVEPEHKEHYRPTWGVRALPSPQHTLPKTPIQATGSELNLLKVYGVRSLTGDGLEGKKLETEKPVKRLHAINVQVRSKKLWKRQWG